MQIIPCDVDLFHGELMFTEVHRTDPVADCKALGQAGIWGRGPRGHAGELCTWQVMGVS
jgi:hypothetical protein